MIYYRHKAFRQFGVIRMQEIYRSRNMASLVVKKQFLEENDIPCRIYVQGMDITDMPSHPVYGMSYRFEQDATLMVDEEDEMSAWNLLHNIENPIEIEEEIDIPQPEGTGGFAPAVNPWEGEEIDVPIG